MKKYKLAALALLPLAALADEPTDPFTTLHTCNSFLSSAEYSIPHGPTLHYSSPTDVQGAPTLVVGVKLRPQSKVSLSPDQFTLLVEGGSKIEVVPEMTELNGSPVTQEVAQTFKNDGVLRNDTDSEATYQLKLTVPGAFPPNFVLETPRLHQWLVFNFHPPYRAYKTFPDRGLGLCGQ